VHHLVFRKAPSLATPPTSGETTTDTVVYSPGIEQDGRAVDMIKGNIEIALIRVSANPSPERG